MDFNKIMGKSDVLYSEFSKGVKKKVGLIKYNTKPPSWPRPDFLFLSHHLQEKVLNYTSWHSKVHEIIIDKLYYATHLHKSVEPA